MPRKERIQEPLIPVEVVKPLGYFVTDHHLHSQLFQYPDSVKDSHVERSPNRYVSLKDIATLCGGHNMDFSLRALGLGNESDDIFILVEDQAPFLVFSSIHSLVILYSGTVCFKKVLAGLLSELPTKKIDVVSLNIRRKQGVAFLVFAVTESWNGPGYQGKLLVYLLV